MLVVVLAFVMSGAAHARWFSAPCDRLLAFEREQVRGPSNRRASNFVDRGASLAELARLGVDPEVHQAALALARTEGFEYRILARDQRLYTAEQGLFGWAKAFSRGTGVYLDAHGLVHGFNRPRPRGQFTK